MFCLFVSFGFFVPLENFSLKWRRHNCRWKAANFDLCSSLIDHILNSNGSLEFHTYRDMGHPFIMAIFEDPWHSHLLPSVLKWSSHYLFFLIQVCLGLDSNTQPSAFEAHPLHHRGGQLKAKEYILK